MARLRIVGLGMACLDILIRAEKLPTWEGGVRLDAMAIEGGGPVATGVVASQRLGVPSGFIGTFGNDRLGEIKLQTISENGVDVSRMIKRENYEGEVVLVSVNKGNGERIFSGVASNNRQLSIDEIDKGYITQADFLHLDGFHSKAALQAAKWIKAAGGKVLLDGSATNNPIPDSMLDLVKISNYLISGKGFGHSLTGEADLWKAGNSILDFGPEVVIQTEGENGSFIVTRKEQFHIPAFKVSVVDTTGAGDVFHGAFLVGLLKGWDIRQVVLFCSAVSAIKCKQLSGRRGIPDFKQTIQFLQSHGYPEFPVI